MIINITPNTILKLRQQGFYADEMLSLFFVLKGLENSEIELLDNYDDFNTSKRAAISYQSLFRKGFIEKDKEGSRLFFRLTEKGKEFLNELEPNKKSVPVISDWIENWLELFPEKNSTGVLRSAVADVIPRMSSFIRKYKHNKEVIIAATKAYLSEESAKNYKYTKRAMYFINKLGEGSLLAAWCSNIEENKGKNGELNDGSRTTIIQTLN